MLCLRWKCENGRGIIPEQPQHLHLGLHYIHLYMNGTKLVKMGVITARAPTATTGIGYHRFVVSL